MATNHDVITEYAHMWPREVYNIRRGNRPLDSFKEALHKKPGVYVLYRDDHPYYIGKTKGSLWRRIRDHALNRKDRYYNFWNFFSAYVVPDSHHVDEIEGVLITAIGITANNARPKIKRISLPDERVGGVLTPYADKCLNANIRADRSLKFPGQSEIRRESPCFQADFENSRPS